MWWAVDFSRIAANPQPIRRLFVSRVHHHHRRLAVRIQERRRQQLTTTRRARASLRARFDELREVPDVVVRTQISKLASLRVRMYRSETEVLDVIWATSLVQQNIPVSPANRAVVEVVNHRPTVLFTKLPLSDSLRVE